MAPSPTNWTGMEGNNRHCSSFFVLHPFPLVTVYSTVTVPCCQPRNNAWWIDTGCSGSCSDRPNSARRGIVKGYQVNTYRSRILPQSSATGGGASTLVKWLLWWMREQLGYHCYQSSYSHIWPLLAAVRFCSKKAGADPFARTPLSHCYLYYPVDCVSKPRWR
jgi:hypothetical protein